MASSGEDDTYTILHAGMIARQVRASANVAFDVDAAGVLLGAHAARDADWVVVLLGLAIAGKVRLAADLPETPDAGLKSAGERGLAGRVVDPD